MTIARPRSLIAALALSALLACAVGPKSPPAPEHLIECVFVAPDHTVETCLHGLGASHLELPDTILFFEKDSVLRIRVPKGHERYHAHLFHRVDVHVVEHIVAALDESGALCVNLADFARPEALIVTSAEHRVKPTAAASPESAALGATVLPPYALSFRLVPKDQAALLVGLQSFRYELVSEVGALQLLATSANRGDMLLSLVDLDQKLGRVFRDAYFHYKPADAALTPRLTVDVTTADGRTWHRTGAWPVPPDAHAATAGTTGADSRALVLRTHRRELLPFAPPPDLSLEYPKEAPRTRLAATARIAAPEGSHFNMVLSHAVPADREAKAYSFQSQSVELTPEQSEVSLAVSLDSIDPSRFPLTAPVAHRVVTKWTTKSGLLERVQPLGKAFLDTFDQDFLPAPRHIIAPSSAAFYDLVNFTGESGIAGLGVQRSLGLAGSGGGSNGDSTPSPNTLPNPLPGSGSWWTNWGGTLVPIDGSAGGSSSSPAGSGAPNPGGPGNPNNPWTWIGPLGPPPPPPAPQNGQLDVKLRCPCKPTPDCKCFMHTWTQSDVMDRVRQYKHVVGPGGRRYEIADYSFFSSHGNLIKCHTPTLIGTVRFSFWVGLTLVHRMYDVVLEFGPCQPKPIAGGNGKKGPGLPKPGDDKPGAPKPGDGKEKPPDDKGPDKPDPRDVNSLPPVPSVDEVFKPLPPRKDDGDEKPTDGEPKKSKIEVDPGEDDEVVANPFNDPSFGVVLARRGDSGRVVATGSISFAAVTGLDQQDKEPDAGFVHAYRTQPERKAGGRFAGWTYDPAKYWPVYDSSKPLGGGRP